MKRVLFFLLLGCAPAAPPKAKLAPPLAVTRGTLDDRFVLTGELEAIASENLVVPRTPTWMVSVRWIAEDGATVKKGDRVVEFDSSSFSSTIDDKRLAVVRADGELASEVAKARADEADKTMEVDRKRADMEKAQVEANVPPDLYPKRLYQEKQLALAQKKDALAKAEDDRASQRRAARLERTVKTVAFQRTERELADLRVRLDELTVRAPRDGMVQIGMNRREGRKFLVGDQTFPGMVVASLPNLGAMQVRARLSDVDDGAVHEGMPAECTLDAFPDKRWKATVKQVSPVARGDGRDLTRRFFDVVVALDQRAPAFMLPGMSMRVEVIRRHVEGALVVPRVAVRSFPGKTEVRLTSGSVQTVEVDWCTELACVLRAGVLEGALVLARGEEKAP